MPPSSFSGAAAAELELADRARSGDRDALVELYERHRAALHRHALRMLGNEAAARDVVQESFARAIEALDRTRPELRFKAWIFRIATNLCLRQLTRERTTPCEDLDRLRSPDAAADPQRQHHRAELGRLVARALARLPDPYRQILLLREVEELTYDELACALQISVDNVKVTLHRARARFAVVFKADQLAALRPGSAADATACPQLVALVDQAAGREPLERHLKRCVTCRGEQRPVGDLLALLPPVAAPPLEPPPLAGGAEAQATPSSPSGSGPSSTLSSTGSSAAGGLTLPAIVAAVSVGLALVAGAAAGAVYLVRKHEALAEASDPRPLRAAQDRSAPGAGGSAAEQEGGAEAIGAPPRPAPQVRAGPTAVGAPARSERGARGWRGSRSSRIRQRAEGDRRRTRPLSHQALDDEDPP